MKRIFAAILCAAVFLCSCAESSENPSPDATTVQSDRSDLVHELEAADHLIGYDGSLDGYYICDGGDALYFVTQAYAHSMIIEYDKKSGTAAPLCKKDGCTHDEPGCSANVNSGLSGLTYHDGKLYFMGADRDGAFIYCEDVKSTVRTVVKSLYSDGLPAAWDAIFLDGKAVYYNAFLVDGEIDAYIGIADLNGGADKTILDVEDGILNLSRSVNIDMQIIDGTLFITSLTYSDQTDLESDITISVFRYDFESDDFSEVISLSSAAGDIPRASSIKLVTENELYFMSDGTRKICRYDIEKKVWDELFGVSEYGQSFGFSDGEIRNYLFLGDLFCLVSVKDGRTVLAAKDLDGNIVFETDLSEFSDGGGHPSVWVTGRDAENIYCCFNYQDAGYTYQLNKTVAVPVNGGSPKLLYCNESSLKRRWQ